MEPAPLSFGPDGRPSLPTLAIAIVLSCRHAEDVERVLSSVQGEVEDGEEASAGGEFVVDEASMKRMVYGVEEGHRDLARLVLRRAAGRALERSSNSMDVMIGEDGQIDGGGSTNTFNGVVE